MAGRLRLPMLVGAQLPRPDVKSHDEWAGVSSRWGSAKLSSADRELVLRYLRATKPAPAGPARRHPARRILVWRVVGRWGKFSGRRGRGGG